MKNISSKQLKKKLENEREITKKRRSRIIMKKNDEISLLNNNRKTSSIQQLTKNRNRNVLQITFLIKIMKIIRIGFSN